MVGDTLEELRKEGILTESILPFRTGQGRFVAVKEAVLPFNRFPDADQVLGPEMRSTGEVMGIDRTFGLAFAKSQVAAGERLPETGTVFFSLADRDKPQGRVAARSFVDQGFEIAATTGTADDFEADGIPVAVRVAKLSEGEPGETAVDLLEAGRIDLVINCPRGRGSRADGDYIRAAAASNRVPLLTTSAAAVAAAEGILDRGGARPDGDVVAGPPPLMAGEAQWI